MIVTKGKKNIDTLSFNYGFQDKSYINRKQRNLKCQTLQLAQQRKSISTISPISIKNIDNHRILHQTNQKKYDYSKDLGYSLNTSFDAMNDPHNSYSTYQTAQKRYHLQRPYQSIDRNVHLYESKQKNQKPLAKEKFYLNQYLKQEFGNYKNSKYSAQSNHYQKQKEIMILTDKLKEFTNQKNGYRKALQQTSLHSKAKYQSNHYRKRFKQNDQTLKQQTNLINQINKEDDSIQRNKQNKSNHSNIQKISDNSKIDNQNIMEKIAKVNKLNQDINKILEKMMMKK